MIKSLEMTKPEILLAIILTLLVLLCVICIIIVFGYFTRKMAIKIDNLSHDMINQKSEVLIGIKEKKVYKQVLNDVSGKKSQTLALDDFIYFLSINPESKSFRELLKLIDNDATKTQITKKYKSLSEDKLLVTLKYSETRASVAWIEIEKNTKDLEGYIKLQLTESFFSFKKKDSFQNIFNEEIQLLDEHKLYLAMNKDAKAVRTKGWTIVKVENSKRLLKTGKEHATNIVQMCKLRYLLKEQGISSHLSSEGSLYFVSPSGRSSNHFTIAKEWNNKITSLLDSSKNYYFDLTEDEVRITTANDFIKDNKSINKALMMVEILSESTHQQRQSKSFVEETWERVDTIHREASSLLKQMKEGPFPIKNTEYDLKETNAKKLVEYYLDMQLTILSQIVRYSYLHKKEIVSLTFNEASKRSAKLKNKIGVVMFDMKNLNILSSLSKKVQARENFLLAFAEDGANYSMEEMNRLFKSLRNEGHEFMQLIRDIEDGSIKIHLSMLPKYILLTKDFSKIHDEEEKINRTLALIEEAKDKKVKIFSLK